MEKAKKPRAARRSNTLNVDHNTTAYKIIMVKFGGLGKFCELSRKATSTVWGWLLRGQIPTIQQQFVLDLARKHKIELTPADFFEGAK